jgi:hypothetical protein
MLTRPGTDAQVVEICFRSVHGRWLPSVSRFDSGRPFLSVGPCCRLERSAHPPDDIYRLWVWYEGTDPLLPPLWFPCRAVSYYTTMGVFGGAQTQCATVQEGDWFTLSCSLGEIYDVQVKSFAAMSAQLLVCGTKSPGLHG